MNIKTINDVVIVNSKEIIIKDIQTAIDFMMSVKYETNCNKIALNKDAIIEDFIYESNNGKDIFFVENEIEALNMLNKV